MGAEDFRLFQRWVEKMMKRTWLGAAAATLLAGCGPTHHILDEGVGNSREVNPVIGVDGDYLGAIALRKPYTEADDALRQRCMHATLEPAPAGVEPMALSSPVIGESRPFNASPSDRQSERQTLTGITDFQGRTFIYRLELQQVADSNYYYFDRLGERQADRGGEAPRYVPIGAWSEAEPMAVHEALGGVADRLQACLAGAGSDAAGSTARAQEADTEENESWLPAPEPSH